MKSALSVSLLRIFLDNSQLRGLGGPIREVDIRQQGNELRGLRQNMDIVELDIDRDGGTGLLLVSAV
jgi:hypothetical protein